MVTAVEDRVIVAGAGPVGLIAALALVQRGVPVLVLEEESAPIQDPRGAAFHPPTLDIIERLGILDPLMDIGLKIPRWQIRNRDGSIVAEFDLKLLEDETKHPYRFHLGQQKLLPVLLAELAKHRDADIRFGTRVTGLSQSGEGIAVQLSRGENRLQAVTGRWLVGADGARSQVRKSAGIEFEGFTWPERFVVTNLADDLEKYGFAYTNYVTDPDRWAVVLRLEDERGQPNWRVTYPTDNISSDEAVLDPLRVQERLADVIPGASQLDVRYAGIYRVHQRVAREFRKGRVLLAGDAAHINNPLGGFGLNSGIQDAESLAEKLAEVWHGRASAELLDAYARQRRTSNIEFVQKASIRNKAMIEERDPDVKLRAQIELAAIASDPQRALPYLLESSMINSVRASARSE
ncbi:putative monooxygenase [Novosphingobium resinovorum]|uniref:Putative monooxygenase n=1 Tax=Novosphingobium resinovorum TaxID=158500 RepID=A0A031K4M6_9SPHN|nr:MULTISPECIES: FAD-dependent monooxygenase [Novosphingobium]EZP83968.1 putative monooxygenase [Novosphingobium resinovorum]